MEHGTTAKLVSAMDSELANSFRGDVNRGLIGSHSNASQDKNS